MRNLTSNPQDENFKHDEVGFELTPAFVVVCKLMSFQAVGKLVTQAS